jgi:hypothetical protein
VWFSERQLDWKFLSTSLKRGWTRYGARNTYTSGRNESGRWTGSESRLEVQRDALVARLFQATLSMMDLFTIYLGDRLGLYRALASDGPMTPAELASRSGTNERYAREWLEQQAVAGLLGQRHGSRAPTRHFGLKGTDGYR